MFESLLEKVLSTFLGQFIEGFDAQNLHVGIWSGEVTIQNVSLKADIIKMLELPIKICFSHIGKLKLNVPWKSLTSSPVEVTLSDLYIILSAEHPDFWQFQDYSGFKKKIDILEKFKESIISNINDKQKSPTEDGYIKKLVLKILDNIQLSVSNIHIRFEDTIRNEFAWGISIKNIETFTCNSEWKKQFFDRVKEENKKVPLQKLLILKNIGAYWNQQETEFLHSQPREVFLANMLALIISQDDPKQFDSPEFALSIELITIDLALENQQLQQIIKMAELFSLFQNRLLLDFKFETNPDHHKGVDKYIKLETGALKLIFNPIILVRIQQFTDFSVQDESLKNAAWDQVEIAQDMAANQISQSQLSPSILFIDVKIKSTIVVVPIPDTKENWLVNLGDVSVVTPRIDDVYYDHFEITLKDFTFKHYKSIEQCQQSITLGQHLENIDGSYPVIQNFKVAITAQILRGSSKPPIEKASVCVQGVLPQLDLFVNPLIYSRVLKIGDCFAEPQRDVEEAQKRQTRLSIEKAQTERTALMQAATKVGKIWKRGQLMTWSQYTAVLSGGYIYLFAKPKDQQPELFFWIRNSDFIDVSEQDAGMKNAFIIKNKYGENLIAMDKPKLVKEWQDAIEELRTQTKAEKKTQLIFPNYGLCITSLDSFVAFIIRNESLQGEKNPYIEFASQTQIKFLADDERNNLVPIPHPSLIPMSFNVGAVGSPLTLQSQMFSWLKN